MATLVTATPAASSAATKSPKLAVRQNAEVTVIERSLRPHSAGFARDLRLGRSRVNSLKKMAV